MSVFLVRVIATDAFGFECVVSEHFVEGGSVEDLQREFDSLQARERGLDRFVIVPLDVLMPEELIRMQERKLITKAKGEQP